MRKVIEFAQFKIRWWRWFLFPPNPTVMELSGFDEYTRDILQERWRKSEPSRLVFERTHQRSAGGAGPTPKS
jgi:hypothetical protein